MMCAKSWQTPWRAVECFDRRGRDLGRFGIVGEVARGCAREIERGFQDRAARREATRRIGGDRGLDRRHRGRIERMRRCADRERDEANAAARTASHSGPTSGSGRAGRRTSTRAVASTIISRCGVSMVAVTTFSPNGPVWLRHALGRGGDVRASCAVTRLVRAFGQREAQRATRERHGLGVAVGRPVADFVDHPSPPSLRTCTAFEPWRK